MIAFSVTCSLIWHISWKIEAFGHIMSHKERLILDKHAGSNNEWPTAGAEQWPAFVTSVVLGGRVDGVIGRGVQTGTSEKSLKESWHTT